MIWTLAQNTFREAVRDRVLHSIVLFAVATVCVALLLKDVTLGDQDKIVRSVAQGGIDLFASIIAMFLGISLVWKEIENKTVYTILSKPVARWQFLMGKYCGLMFTILVEVLLLSLTYVCLLTWQQGFPTSIFFVSMGMLLVELMLLTAWAVLFSTYSAPTTASAFVLSIFVIGHVVDDLWLLGNKSENQVLADVVKTLYWLMPNFEVLSIREDAVHQRDVPWARVWTGIGYGVSYTVLVLLAAMGIFAKKDIK